MIEFIDIEIIKAVVILFFVSGLLVLSFRLNSKDREKSLRASKKSKEKYYWLAYIVLLAVIPFLQAKSAKTDAEENIKSFQGAKVLRCNTNTNQYRVSKKESWEVEQYFFIKDSLMIRADKCEKF